MFWRRMKMQELRDRLLSQMPVAEMTESEIEKELALVMEPPSRSFDLRRRGKLQYAAGELAAQTSGVRAIASNGISSAFARKSWIACWRDAVGTIGSTGSTRNGRRCSSS